MCIVLYQKDSKRKVKKMLTASLDKNSQFYQLILEPEVSKIQVKFSIKTKVK